MNKRSSEENNPNIFLLVLAYYLYLGYMDFGHVKVCYFFKKTHFIQFPFAVYNRLACVPIALFGTETNLISCLNNRVNKPANTVGI